MGTKHRAELGKGVLETSDVCFSSGQPISAALINPFGPR